MNEQVVNLSIDDIIPNRFQPREVFRDQALDELALSIKEHGVIQPIIVRQIVNNKYEIIAGERRYKASTIAGKTTIPAIARNLDDKETSKQALLENIQRQDLTPIEEAHAYQELLRINKLTQDELAKSLGKTQATVANKLRLLKLSKKVIEAINSKKITERHGRAMVKLDESAQEKILSQILSQNLNVSQTEEKIDTYLKIKKDVKPVSTNANYDAQKLVIKLTKEIAKLEEKYGIDLNKDEEENMENIVIKVTIPRYLKKEVNDENFSDM